jgi:hypothetical protein
MLLIQNDIISAKSHQPERIGSKSQTKNKTKPKPKTQDQNQENAGISRSSGYAHFSDLFSDL